MNSFQLDQAGLIIAYQPKDGFGALVDLMAGEDARILHAAGTAMTTPSIFARPSCNTPPVH